MSSLSFVVSLLFYCRTTGLQRAIPNSNGKSVSYIAALVALSVNSIISNIASSIKPGLFLCIAVHVANVPTLLFVNHRCRA